MTTAPACKILIADDGISSADLLVMFFKLEGFEARAVYNGAEALEAFQAMRPEIVFLDIDMPVLDGCETARRLRSLPGGDKPILVALTGWGAESDRLKSLDAGFDHHFVKPLEPKALREFIAGTLSAR